VLEGDYHIHELKKMAWSARCSARLKKLALLMSMMMPAVPDRIVVSEFRE